MIENTDFDVPIVKTHESLGILYPGSSNVDFLDLRLTYATSVDQTNDVAPLLATVPTSYEFLSRSHRRRCRMFILDLVVDYHKLSENIV